MRRSKIIAAEVYAGAGGMSLGAKMASIDVKVAIEINKEAAKTYKHNHQNTDIIIDDVRNIKEIKLFNWSLILLQKGALYRPFTSCLYTEFFSLIKHPLIF